MEETDYKDKIIENLIEQVFELKAMVQKLSGDLISLQKENGNE